MVLSLASTWISESPAAVAAVPANIAVLLATISEAVVAAVLPEAELATDTPINVLTPVAVPVKATGWHNPAVTPPARVGLNAAVLAADWS